MADDLSFLQEIDDSLRTENLERFWKENGKIILAGCVLVVIMTLVTGIWKSHVHGIHAQETDILLQAEKLAAAGKVAEAEPVFDQAAKGSPSIAALSRIREAEMVSDAGQNDKALALYKQIAADKSRAIDEGIRDLALIRAETIEDNQTHGTATLEKNQAFDATVGELVAVQLINQGKNTEARNILTSISQTNTLPQSQRMRAYELLSAIPEDAK